MVLFAKVVHSTLALLPFFVFIEKRLGQHWRKYAKKTLVLGISYVPQIDFNSIMRYYRGDIFIIIML